MAADVLIRSESSSESEAKKPFITKKGPKVEFTTSTGNGKAAPDAMTSPLAMAEAHSMKAEKNARPNVTCWRPQHRKAGDEFCQAALMFCEAGDRKRGMEMLLKACECYKKKRVWHCAAKTLDQAIILAHEEGEFTKLAGLAWRSAALYRKAGHPDSAAQVLERAGKIIEAKHPQVCLDMLEKAAETVETENRPIQAASYVNKLLKMTLNRNDYDSALEKSRKLLQLYQEAGHKNGTGKAVLGLVILLLKTLNVDEAEAVVNEYGSFCSREQTLLLGELVCGFDNQERHRLETALRSPVISGLDHEYASVLDDLEKMAAEFSVTNEFGGASNNNNNDDQAGGQPHQHHKAPIYDGAGELDLIDEDEDKSESGTTTTTAESTVTSSTTTSTPKDEDPTETEEDSPEHNMETSGQAVLPVCPTKKVVQKSISVKPDESKRLVPPRRHLRKLKTVSSFAGLGGISESVASYSPRALSPQSAGPFLDAAGIDVVNPAQLGMTTDQWRETKKLRSAATSDEHFLAAADDDIDD